MAVKTTPLDGTFPDIIVEEADAVSAPSKDLFDGPVSLYNININNSANAGSVAIVRLYDALDAAPASDVPLLKFNVAASSRANITIADGLTFLVGVTLRCTTATADNDTADPSSNVIVYMTGS